MSAIASLSALISFGRDNSIFFGLAAALFLGAGSNFLRPLLGLLDHKFYFLLRGKYVFSSVSLEVLIL